MYWNPRIEGTSKQLVNAAQYPLNLSDYQRLIYRLYPWAMDESTRLNKLPGFYHIVNEVKMQS